MFLNKPIILREFLGVPAQLVQVTRIFSAVYHTQKCCKGQKNLKKWLKNYFLDVFRGFKFLPVAPLGPAIAMIPSSQNRYLKI